jgi:hypothetical protein
MVRGTETQLGELTMLTTSNFGGRFAAAISAFALSLVLISATVSMPSSAKAQGAEAYVSVVA